MDCEKVGQPARSGVEAITRDGDLTVVTLPHGATAEGEAATSFSANIHMKRSMDASTAAAASCTALFGCDVYCTACDERCAPDLLCVPGMCDGHSGGQSVATEPHSHIHLPMTCWQYCERKATQHET